MDEGGDWGEGVLELCVGGYVAAGAVWLGFGWGVGNPWLGGFAR